MALEVLPRDILVSQVRVDYKKSAVLGDKIFPETAQKKDRVIVRLCDEDRKPYAVIEFKTGCRSYRSSPARISSRTSSTELVIYFACPAMPGAAFDMAYPMPTVSSISTSLY